MTAPARITFRLLGRFAATVDDGAARIVQISAPMRRGLIAYLAMQPGLTETRERLATLLWGERSDRLARQNLRQSLVQLRKEFEPSGLIPLVIDRDTVGLDPALVAIDAHELAALAQSDDLDALERAVALIGGEFLDGGHLDVEPFDDWLRAERARIAAIAAQVFEKYATRQEQAGNGPQAIRAAERLVALDPLREGAQRLLLRLLARHRGRDAALVQAAALTRLLRDELDAEPEPETAKLVADIRSGAIEPAPAPALIMRRSVDEPAAPSEAVQPPAGAPAEAAAALDPLASGQPAAPRDRTWAWLPRSAVVGWAIAGLAMIGVVGMLTLARDRPLAPLGERQAQAPADATDAAAMEQRCRREAADRSGASALGPAEREKIVADCVARLAEQSWKPPSILTTASAGNSPQVPQGISAVVVLPFTTAAGARSPEQVLADRITGDLINDLSRVPVLRVIAAQTSRLYAGRRIDVAAIGAELGVRYVVEGSLQLQDQQMRINIALVDAKTRLQVWADRIERETAERFAVQDAIARSLARELHVSVLTAEDRRRPPTAGGDATVNDLLAKGWAAMLRISALGTTSGADGYFEEVLRRDPENVSALIGLGGYHVTLVAMFFAADPAPHLARAEPLLRRAVEKAPSGVMGHYFLGVLHKVRRQPRESLEAFRRALERNPSFALAYAQVGHAMSRFGRLDEAMEHIRYAVRLSPKDPNLGLWSIFAGEIELERGNDAAALEWLTRSVEIDPRLSFSHVTLAALHALRGDDAAAARQVAEVARLAPWLTRDVMIERLTGASLPGHEPHRLIDGIRRAFVESAVAGSRARAD